MTDNKNTILAIALSALVCSAGNTSLPCRRKKRGRNNSRRSSKRRNRTHRPPPSPARRQPTQAGQRRRCPARPATPAAAAPIDRAAALAASPRVPIATGSVQGSIALKGGRIDDLALVKFRETVDPKSPPIVLLSPSGTADPFYAEFGWTGDGRHQREIADRGYACGSSRAPARSASAIR